MTDDNRRHNAADELARASVCLDEARALHAASLPFGAASRAYYAVFHAARALLVTVGLEAKSHRAAVSLVGEHFVKPGRLSPSEGRLVSRMQRDREDADYSPGAVFTADEAARMIRDAEAFVATARSIVSDVKP